MLFLNSEKTNSKRVRTQRVFFYIFFGFFWVDAPSKVAFGVVLITKTPIKGYLCMKKQT